LSLPKKEKKMNNWFDVDKEGLRQINDRHDDYGWVIGELYQNVMDTTATECLITITKFEGQPRAEIIVEDDGPGFAHLKHAWTMFAPSIKTDNPTKAGRFNLGEKFVLAACYTAKIETTCGTVKFDVDGRHELPRRKFQEGTKVTLEIRCTNEQYMQLLDYAPKLFVREGLRLCVNGAEMAHREELSSWEETLPTVIGEDLRPTRRKAHVRIYEAKEGETPMLYELGIPVVETGDRWHVSIGQKVPLNTERDNVTPAFLREVRVSVVNNMYEELTEEDTESGWVNEATSDKRCENDAAEDFRIKKYGENSVASTPGNPEADAKAVAEGYTLIPSRGLTGGQRENLKEAGTLNSSAAEFPTAGIGAFSDDPNAPEAREFEEDELTDGMREVRDYAASLGKSLMNATISVRFLDNIANEGQTFRAAYGGRELCFNVGNLGKKWFANSGAVGTTELDALLIHEFGHHYESNHLSSDYHRALCRLGAKLKAVHVLQLESQLQEYARNLDDRGGYKNEV
jgi:hypothetical protein